MIRFVTGFILALSLLAPSWSQAALTVGVQDCAAVSSATTVTTAAVTTTSGSGMVVGVVWTNTYTLTSITDTYSNTWVQIETELADANFSVKSRMYYAANITGGVNHTVTLTVSSATTASICAQEILASNATGVALDQSGRQSDNATPFISTSETTLVNDEFMYAFGAGNGAGSDTWTAGNSFTKQDNITDGSLYWPVAHGTRIVTGTGTYNSSWTVTSSTATSQWIATFSENAPPGSLSQQPSSGFLGVITQ